MFVFILFYFYHVYLQMVTIIIVKRVIQMEGRIHVFTVHRRTDRPHETLGT